MLWRGNNEIRGWRGLGAINSIGATGVTTAGVNNILDLRVILDTRTEFNTVTFLYKNPDATEWNTYASATLVSSTIESIKSVGFSTVAGSSAGIQSFELTVDSSAPADPYLAWAGEGVLFGDDANEDGVSNGLAFLLGASSPNANALDLLPTVSESAGGLVMSFSMLESTARGGATLAIEHSSDLGISGPWNAVTVPDTTSTVADVDFTVAGTGPLTVTATIPAGKAVGGKLFGRLKATE